MLYQLFKRVDPAIISSLVFKIIFISPNLKIFPLGLFEIAIVKAFFTLDNSKILHVKGVLPLAAIPKTTSFLFTSISFIISKTLSILSSAFSIGFIKASFPPAIINQHAFWAIQKWGKSSTPS